MPRGWPQVVRSCMTMRNGKVYNAQVGIARLGYCGLRRCFLGLAQLVNGPRGILCAETAPPIRVMQTVTPVGVKETKPGVFVFDMGQNFAGWVQLKVSGPAGKAVTMHYGERINAAGDLERETIDVFVQQGPFQTDTYILSGCGEEVYEPRFTYHGFRWVEVTGFPGRPTLDGLRGRVVHTAFRPAGSFVFRRTTEQDSAGDPVVIPQQLRGYSHGLPAPREERLDGRCASGRRAGACSTSTRGRLQKWINDLSDEQRPTRQLPGIVPNSGWGYEWGNGPAWDSAFLLMPYTATATTATHQLPTITRA